MEILSEYHIPTGFPLKSGTPLCSTLCPEIKETFYFDFNVKMFLIFPNGVVVFHEGQPFRAHFFLRVFPHRTHGQIDQIDQIKSSLLTFSGSVCHAAGQIHIPHSSTL